MNTFMNGFRDVQHNSTSLTVLKNDTVDIIFKLKTSKALFYYKSDVVMILVLCKFSDHALNLSFMKIP